MVEEFLQSMADDFEKVLESFKKELTAIRTGRATPALVENIPVIVTSYAATMPLNQLATITAPEARMLIINPWDKGTLKDIEKGIQGTGLGLNASNDGVIIRVPIPPLTGERRKEMVKSVGKMTEDARVRSRGVRREYNDIFKGMENDKDITQDELKRLSDVVQKATDESIKRIEDVATAKEKEVLEV